MAGYKDEFYNVISVRNINDTVMFFSVHAMKAYRRIIGVAPLIINLGTRWRTVVNLTL
jgi:hypothetical protein